MGNAAGNGPTFAWAALSWNVVAAGLYAVVTFFFFFRFAAGIIMSRRLVRRSQSITEALAVERLALLGISLLDWRHRNASRYR
jgi:hypothetical protein